MRMIHEGEGCASPLFGSPLSQPIHSCGDQLGYCRHSEQTFVYADVPLLGIGGWDASGADGSVATAHVILSP